MKKIFTLIGGLILLLTTTTPSYSQCAGGRYHSLVFPGSPTVTSDVVYGNNLDSGGHSIILKLDVYQPACDTAHNRACVVFAHGGSFVTGDKADAGYAATAIALAQLGYVVASINYRLGFPTSGLAAAYGFNSAIVRGMHDGRAAVRFMRNSALNTGNPYGIDPNNIYFGGVSAGGIIALHLAYQNTTTEMNAMNCGGQPGTEQSSIEGTSNGTGSAINNISSAVRAIISISGGLRDTTWIINNDIPVCMAHGTVDGTVPYGYGTFGGFFPVYGSSCIAQRCIHTGTTYCFTPMIGQDHTPSNTAYVDTIATLMRNFLEHFTCNTTLQCAYNGSPAVLVPAISIAITSGSNPTCNGQSVTFTATASNGGTNLSYQWKKGSTNVGTNSPTYTLTTPANGDAISCVLTTCASPTSTTSNTITMTVSSVSPAGVSIAVTSGANPTCAGLSVTFTATPTNGGTSPSYQWKKGSTNVGTNSPTYTLTPTNGDVISCVMTSNSPCASPTTGTSGPITITVNTAPTITLNGNILTSTSSGSYQWYRNGTLISGATSQTYTATQSGNYTVAGAGGCQSQPVTVTITAIENLIDRDYSLMVYPNPNNGNFKISFIATVKQDYAIECKNVNGAVIYQEVLNTFSGPYEKKLDATKFASGIYLISLSDGKETVTKQVVVN